MTSHGLRLLPRRGGPPAQPEAAEEDRAIEFAWRVHKAQATWANNADVKASILLALEGGAVFAAISALSDGGFLARQGGRLDSIGDAIGVGALLLAIAAAAIAIFPRLGDGWAAGLRLRRKSVAPDRSHVIYFGDLRHWRPAELRSRLTGLAQDDELDMLSRQLAEMARYNWGKHRWVQMSLILSLAGILIIAVATLIPA